ncbi:hypothetical protein ACLOJK_025472 [Asimina triloba]
MNTGRIAGDQAFLPHLVDFHAAAGQCNIGEDDHLAVDVLFGDVQDGEPKSSQQHVVVHGIDRSEEPCIRNPDGLIAQAIYLPTDLLVRRIVGPTEVGIEDGKRIAVLKDGVVPEYVAGALSRGGEEHREEKIEEEDGSEGFSHGVQKLYYSLPDSSLVELGLDLLLPTNAFLRLEDGVSFQCWGVSEGPELGR